VPRTRNPTKNFQDFAAFKLDTRTLITENTPQLFPGSLFSREAAIFREMVLFELASIDFILCEYQICLVSEEIIFTRI
jgi:hypothetical protein